MTNWPKDNQAARNAFYGDPGKGEIPSQMIDVIPPFRMTYTDEHGTKVISRIPFHKKCAAALRAALDEIWEVCEHDQAKVDASGASKYFGAYNHRMVRGSSTKWSNHAYAAAIDLDANNNALGVKKGTMPQFIIDAFCRQGAMWGGWYSSRPDWMHFEFVDNGGRQPESAPPHRGGVAPPVAAAVTAKPVDTSDRRTRMGRVILGFEARRDKDGHLAVYKLPANDGGGTYEVAGINDRYHPEQASNLRALIQAGKFDQAEASAIEYMVKYTDIAAGWTTNAGVEFYLRDCVFNRGPGGAAKILQLALGIGVDGSVGTETRDALSKAEPGVLLDKLRAARERYEDMVAPGRPNLRQGLINRWNNALAAAKKFAAETPTSSQKNLGDAAKVIVAGGGAGAVTHGVNQGWGVLEWSLLGGGTLLVLALVFVACRYGWPRYKAWRAMPKPYHDVLLDGQKAAPAVLPAAPATSPMPAVKPTRRKQPAARKPAAKPKGRKKTAARPTKSPPSKRKAA